MRAHALLFTLFSVPLANAQDTFGVTFQLIAPEPPITAGLSGIRMEHDAGPFGTGDSPSGKAPFCLYIPDGGLEISISGLHDNAGVFRISTGDPDDPAISYTVKLEDLITGEGVLGEFTPGAPILINRPGLSDDGECALGDNVSLEIAFPDTLEASFTEIVTKQLAPGRSYEYSDVLTISFSAPL